MIGIDLVELGQAKTDSNWQRKGYLDKVFTVKEQTMIKAQPDATKMVWLLWSMKEAGYKIWSREANLSIYAPVKLVCKNIHFKNNYVEGMVSYMDNYYYTRSVINDHYIYTIAAPDKATLKNIRVSIIKTSLVIDCKSTNPQSLSHHGQYLALAYL